MNHKQSMLVIFSSDSGIGLFLQFSLPLPLTPSNRYLLWLWLKFSISLWLGLVSLAHQLTLADLVSLLLTLADPSWPHLTLADPSWPWLTLADTGWHRLTLTDPVWPWLTLVTIIHFYLRRCINILGYEYRLLNFRTLIIFFIMPINHCPGIHQASRLHLLGWRRPGMGCARNRNS